MKAVRHLGLAAAAVALAAGVLVMVTHEPATTGDGRPGTGAGESAADADGGGSSGLAQSASKVDASAHWSTPAADRAPDRIRVVLDIADGWHVNANPASLDFLIPTRVTASANGSPLKVSPRYPPGRESDIELEGKRIRVYGDATVIAVDVPPESRRTAQASGSLELTVRVQSCSDDGTCLAPSDLHLTADTPADT